MQPAEFVQLLKEKRLKLGMTVEQAAEASSVSRSAWYKAEKGTSTPRPENLQAMARAVDVPVSALSPSTPVPVEQMETLERDQVAALREKVEELERRLADSQEALRRSEITRTKIDKSRDSWAVDAIRLGQTIRVLREKHPELRDEIQQTLDEMKKKFPRGEKRRRRRRQIPK